MNDILHRLQRSLSDSPFPGLAISIGSVSGLTALALYGYLGTFSRYESDDYCLSAFFYQDNLVNAMIERYYVSSSRYTNILFIGLADNLFGWYNVAVLPALMLSLFVWGMYLLLKEISKTAPLSWSRGIILFLSVLVVYFSVTQAPDLYETLYWRAGMTSHFAPAVFMPFWGTFLFRQIRSAGERAPALWIRALCFIIPFVIGGLSEPPTALMITILSLAIAVVWWWGRTQDRRSILILLAWSLAGALTALLLMGLAPANSLRMQSAPPGWLYLVSRIAYYPSLFIVDTLRTLPVPTLISITVTGLLFYVQYTHSSQALSGEARSRLGMLMIIILMLAYLFIAASFAPSIYGQSFPVPRARFIARVVMTCAFMAEGAVLGILLAQIGAKSLSLAVRPFAIVLFIVLALYPLRTVWRVFEEIPVYQQRATVWDMRDAEIRALKEQGAQDLVVRFLSEIPIQDLGDRTGFRLNRCASTLYGVNSIVAVPMED